MTIISELEAAEAERINAIRTIPEFAAGDTLRLSFMNAAGEVMHNRSFTLPTVTPHP